MAKYMIDNRPLSNYFEGHMRAITAIENWQHKTDEIVCSVSDIAPDIPVSVIRKAYLRERKNWKMYEVADTTFDKLFEKE